MPYIADRHFSFDFTLLGANAAAAHVKFPEKQPESKHASIVEARKLWVAADDAQTGFPEACNAIAEVRRLLETSSANIGLFLHTMHKRKEKTRRCGYVAMRMSAQTNKKSSVGAHLRAIADAICRLHRVQWCKVRCKLDRDVIFMFYGIMANAGTAAQECREQFEKVTDLSALHSFWGTMAVRGGTKASFCRGYAKGINENVNKLIKINAPSREDAGGMLDEASYMEGAAGRFADSFDEGRKAGNDADLSAPELGRATRSGTNNASNDNSA